MKVCDLMTKNTKTLSIHDRIQDAQNVFEHFKISAVPILDDNDTVVGVFSKSDLHSVSNKSIHLSQFCHNSTITIEKEASLDQAVELLKQNQIHHLVVTDDDSKVEGMLSTFDFLELAKFS